MNLFNKGNFLDLHIREIVGVSEAAIHRCSTKWVFLKILQIPQNSTCAEVTY